MHLLYSQNIHNFVESSEPCKLPYEKRNPLLFTTQKNGTLTSHKTHWLASCFLVKSVPVLELMSKVQAHCFLWVFFFFFLRWSIHEIILKRKFLKSYHSLLKDILNSYILQPFSQCIWRPRQFFWSNLKPLLQESKYYSFDCFPTMYFLRESCGDHIIYSMNNFCGVKCLFLVLK